MVIVTQIMNRVDGTPQKPLHVLYVCESEPYLKNNLSHNWVSIAKSRKCKFRFNLIQVDRSTWMGKNDWGSDPNLNLYWSFRCLFLHSRQVTSHVTDRLDWLRTTKMTVTEPVLHHALLHVGECESIYVDWGRLSVEVAHQCISIPTALPSCIPITSIITVFLSFDTVISLWFFLTWW